MELLEWEIVQKNQQIFTLWVSSSAAAGIYKNDDDGLNESPRPASPSRGQFLIVWSLPWDRMYGVSIWCGSETYMSVINLLR